MKHLSRQISILILIILLLGGFYIWRNISKTETSTITLENSNTVEIQEDPEEENPTEDTETKHPHSLPALMEKDFQGSDFTIGNVLATNDIYTRHFLTYTSEGFTISGIINIPHGDGPFPVLILNHGYIDPAVYTNGQGLKREQDYFARQGYVVIHSDYRNHALSDTDPENDIKPRTGYTEDIINVIMALKKANPTNMDTDHIGMLGHSMGGGVTLNVMVVKPELVDAYVLLAPINATYKENFDRWVAPEMDDIAQRTLEYYGTFEDNPEFWKTVSAINYFDRVHGSTQLRQGSADIDVPVEWSRQLNQNLLKAGKDITYYEYEDGPHTFINEQSLVMQRSLDFFDTHVKGK